MATLEMVQPHPTPNVTGRVTSTPLIPPSSGVATGKPIPFVTYRDGHEVVVVVTGVVVVVV